MVRIAALGAVALMAAAAYASHGGNNDTPKPADHRASAIPTSAHPLYPRSAEAETGKVVQAEMDAIGAFARTSARTPDDYLATPAHYTTQKRHTVGKAVITEMYGVAPNGTTFDVAWKGDKVVAADVSVSAYGVPGNKTSVPPDPGTKGTASDDVLYAAPGSYRYLTQPIDGSLLPANPAGWTADENKLNDTNGTYSGLTPQVYGTGTLSGLLQTDGSYMSNEAFTAFATTIDADNMMHDQPTYPS